MCLTINWCVPMGIRFVKVHSVQFDFGCMNNRRWLISKLNKDLFKCFFFFFLSNFFSFFFYFLIVKIDLLKKHTIFGDKVNPSAKHIQYFWNVLSSFTQEELKRFIQFTYAQRRLPSTDLEWKTSRTAQLRIKLYR